MKKKQAIDNTNILSEEQKSDIINIVKGLEENASVADLLKKIQLKYVWKTTVRQYFFVLAALFAFVSFIYLIIPDKHLCFKNYRIDGDKIPIIDFLIYAFWAIAPPFFFLYEYLKKFPYKLDQAQFNDLKYTHELSTKIWAALLFIFGIILYAKYDVR